MVQDARVSHHLSRLGGVYRDPARVNRDASTLLKSSVGSLLQPIMAVHVDSNGSSSTVLVLQGTIAIHFRGNTYQLLIDIYLVPGYPVRPPVCYVRLANSSMYLKQNHKHVGSDGKVYLPYLHEWTASSHNLVELVVEMSSVFSAEPPVFSRPPTLPTTPPRIGTTAVSSGRTDPVAYGTTMNGTSTVVPPSSYSFATISGSMTQQQQLEAMLAQEAAEANAAIDVARRAEAEELQRTREIEIQKQRELAKLNDLRSAVLSKIRYDLIQRSNQVKKDVMMDWKDASLLNLSTTNKVEYQLDLYSNLKAKLVKERDTVSQRIKDIEFWLEENDKHRASTDVDNSQNENGGIVEAYSPLDQQMLDLASENAALQDVLYFLDRALYNGDIDCTTHLKHVRKIAKQQFLARALLIKVRNVRSSQGQ